MLLPHWIGKFKQWQRTLIAESSCLAHMLPKWTLWCCLLPQNLSSDKAHPLPIFDESCCSTLMQACGTNSAVRWQWIYFLSMTSHATKVTSYQCCTIRNQRATVFHLYTERVFFELWGGLRWFLHWLCVVFQNISIRNERVSMFSVLFPGKIHLWPQQLGDQSNLLSIPSPTSCHQKSY